MAIILTTRHITPLWGTDAHGRPVALEARTPALLRLRQAAYCADNPAVGETQVIDVATWAYVGYGAWRIKCRCGERTHADPEWRLACCFGCGAVYTNVVFPPERYEIERLLALRPVQGHRNWAPPETYDQLVAEQIAHGDPV